MVDFRTKGTPEIHDFFKNLELHARKIRLLRVTWIQCRRQGGVCDVSCFIIYSFFIKA